MELNYISKWGALLSLYNNDYFFLTNVDGMTYATTDISSITIGGVDGDTVSNIQAQPRGIVMDFRIKGGVNVETAKRAVLSVIKLKQQCTLQWTQNNRVLQIQGVVESVEMPRFNNEVTMQVSIHCGQPFWEDVNEIVNELNEAIPLHWFTDTEGDMLYFTEDGRALGELNTSRTRTFTNYGDVGIGMTIEVLAYATVTNPIIYNQDGDFFGVNVTMAEGDVLTIVTVKGQKTVALNGSSVLADVMDNSTWLQLEAGDNEFSIDSEDEETDNMTFTLNYTQRYI